MPPATPANPDFSLCQTFVRLKGLAMFAMGTGVAFAVLKKPLPLPWSGLLSLALAALPTYGLTRKQLKNCADTWEFQTPPSQR